MLSEKKKHKKYCKQIHIGVSNAAIMIMKNWRNKIEGIFGIKIHNSKSYWCFTDRQDVSAIIQSSKYSSCQCYKIENLSINSYKFKL